jgi:hypothetical protein
MRLTGTASPWPKRHPFRTILAGIYDPKCMGYAGKTLQYHADNNGGARFEGHFELIPIGSYFTVAAKNM